MVCRPANLTPSSVFILGISTPLLADSCNLAVDHCDARNSTWAEVHTVANQDHGVANIQRRAACPARGIVNEGIESVGPHHQTARNPYAVGWLVGIKGRAESHQAC